MAKTIQLKPMKEWGEKAGDKPLKTVRIYVGELHVATVEPVKGEPDLWFCHDMTGGVLNASSRAEVLEDHKINIELSIKEFINKVLKKFEA